VLHDGLGRRVKKHLNTDGDGDFDEYRHFFYNTSWQILETRKSTSDPCHFGSLGPADAWSKADGKGRNTPADASSHRHAWGAKRGSKSTNSGPIPTKK